MQKQKVPIGYELWNNIGVLRQKLKKYRAAEEAYHAALNVVGANGIEVKAQTVSTLYNIARLYEGI